MPSPRWALPMISETLSSSGMAMEESGEGFGVAQGRDSSQRNLFNKRGDFHDRAGAAGFLFNRRHRHIRDAAGNDLIKGRQVAANIQRKTVHGDPMADADSDRRDLPVLHPHAGQTRPSRGGNGGLGQRFDEQSFEPAQITMQILAAAPQIDHWIADQLSRPMIGRLSAAVNRKQRMGQKRAVAQTRLVRRPSDRVNWIMLEQKQLVA